MSRFEELMKANQATSVVGFSDSPCQILKTNYEQPESVKFSTENSCGLNIYKIWNLGSNPKSVTINNKNNYLVWCPYMTNLTNLSITDGVVDFDTANLNILEKLSLRNLILVRSIINLDNLTSLDISGSNITIIPATATKLTYLSVYDTKVRVLPKILANLETLDIYKSGVTNLPAEYQEHLKNVRCSYEQLKTLFIGWDIKRVSVNICLTDTSENDLFCPAKSQ
jgi:hypothetical protein